MQVPGALPLTQRSWSDSTAAENRDHSRALHRNGECLFTLREGARDEALACRAIAVRQRGTDHGHHLFSLTFAARRKERGAGGADSRSPAFAFEEMLWSRAVSVMPSRSPCS